MRNSRRPSTTNDERRRPSQRDVPGEAALVVVIDNVDRIEQVHGGIGLADVSRTAGQRIRLTLRRDDSTAQWGAEELVVTLRDVDIESAMEVGQRIRIAVSQPITLPDGRSLVPSCSVGCASGDPKRMDELVERAHRALELAKASGGNCVRRALPVEERRSAGFGL